MTIPNWVTEAADAFWQAAGEYEQFPRNLRTPVAFALPVAIVTLPRLGLHDVDEWLRRQEINCGLEGRNRQLRACLVAFRGHGVIFVDGSDPADEQRISLAHEVAHYLRDYWLPRKRTLACLGPAALGILDGDRPAWASDRIQAVLSKAELGFHVHLMHRARDGAIVDASVEQAERSADLLGCELLAPAQAVLDGLQSIPYPDKREAVARRLVAEFGLSVAQAADHSARLVPAPDGDSLIRRLGFSL